MTNEFMTAMIQTLIPALAQALLHFLWQGAAIGVSAWLVLRILRSARPQARYAVACLALAACLWLPLQTLQRALQPTTGTVVITEATNAGIAIDATPTALVTLGNVFRTHAAPFDAATPWVVAVWSLGVGAMLLRLLAGLSWLQRAHRNARLPVPEIWQSRLRMLSSRMGLGDRARLLLSDDGDGPFSAGVFRPVVIVPAALLARMPVELLEALLAHELAHIRRHDYLVNLLQTLVESLLFYHPAVWWLSHRIRIERELIADDIAANAIGEPRRLALALSALDRYAAAPHPHASHALVQAAQGGHLMTRIQQLILPPRPGIGARIALPAVALIAAGVACFAYAHVDKPQPRIAMQATQRAETQPQRAGNVDASVATVDRGVVRVGDAATGDVATIGDGRAHEGYALVKDGTDKFSFSGDLDNVKEVRAAQAALDGDFLWFRRDGKPYVVRDPAVVARIERAWAATSDTEAKMQALGREMEAHGSRAQAIGQRMSALGEEQAPSQEIHRNSAQLQRLAMEQGRLAQQQAELAIDGGSTAQAAAELEIERRMEALDIEMERLSETIEAASEAINARMAPLEALTDEMEAATAPLEALGAEMEALGEQMEAKINVVDREIREEIERAVREGRAEPAPTRQ